MHFGLPEYVYNALGERVSKTGPNLRMRTEMNKVTCDSCGHTFVPAPPQSAVAALISERQLLDVATEREAEIAQCPKCGHSQRAQTYKFFGFLPAGGVRVWIALIVGGMFAFGGTYNVGLDNALFRLRNLRSRADRSCAGIRRRTTDGSGG